MRCMACSVRQTIFLSMEATTDSYSWLSGVSDIPKLLSNPKPAKAKPNPGTESVHTKLWTDKSRQPVQWTKRDEGWRNEEKTIVQFKLNPKFASARPRHSATNPQNTIKT